MGLLADRDKVAIVRAILSLAQALGMETTAEGVETLDLAQTLTALGCTYGQGAAFARALEHDAAYAYQGERKQPSAARSARRSEVPTAELQSLMRLSHDVFCVKTKILHNEHC